MKTLCYRRYDSKFNKIKQKVTTITTTKQLIFYYSIKQYHFNYYTCITGILTNIAHKQVNIIVTIKVCLHVRTI